MSGLNEEIPVFISSTELIFRVNGKQPVKLFTLYNPFGYQISYKILCTATRNYTVSDAIGTLQGECCKDIVVRCIQRAPIGTTDKLKVEVSQKRGDLKPQILGSRVILLKTVSNDYVEEEEDKKSSKHESSVMSASVSGSDRSDRRESASFVYFLLALILAVALVCPTAGDPNAVSSSVPAVFHITLPQKLVAAYVLGIVTILILRPL